MDPLLTYFEAKNRVISRQKEVMGDIDLGSLVSCLGSGSGAASSEPQVADDAPQEEEKVFCLLREFLDKYIGCYKACIQYMENVLSINRRSSKKRTSR